MRMSHPSLYRYLSRTVQRSSADEILDAISEGMYQTIRMKQHTVVCNEDAFITKVAKRHIIKEMYRKDRFTYPDSDNTSWSVLEQTVKGLQCNESNAEYIDAETILRSAPESYAEVMKMFYYEGLNLKEAADRAGISHAAMRKRHERALRWARETFG
jgi:RNA polymerase sigma factor (sigma-70 family)